MCKFWVRHVLLFLLHVRHCSPLFSAVKKRHHIKFVSFPMSFALSLPCPVHTLEIWGEYRWISSRGIPIVRCRRCPTYDINHHKSHIIYIIYICIFHIIIDMYAYKYIYIHVHIYVIHYTYIAHIICDTFSHNRVFVPCRSPCLSFSP